MSKTYEAYYIFYLNMVLLLSCKHVFSQIPYSEVALTGRAIKFTKVNGNIEISLTTNSNFIKI